VVLRTFAAKKQTARRTTEPATTIEGSWQAVLYDERFKCGGRALAVALDRESFLVRNLQPRAR
jgi:hypothetical protein